MNPIEKEVTQIMGKIENKSSIPDHGNDWINLADLGGCLRKNGIDYGQYGFDKLTSFLRSFSSLEFYVDDRKSLPVVYAREKKNYLQTNNPNKTYQRKEQIDPSQALMNWAFLGHFPKAIARLKDMALVENWGIAKNENGDDVYPVLINYLQYTFYKLTKEKNKIFYSNDKEYAVFNTGLVDSRYKQIFALFKKNRNPKYAVDWYLVDFCIEGEDRAGKTLVDQFAKMPSTAHYFNEVTDMLFDTRIGKPQLDIEHILIERMERLPWEFVKANVPQGFDIRNPESMTGEEKRAYYDELRKAIREDESSYRQMTHRLEDALSIAIERVKWNFKSAIPMYYPKKDKMCLFLPLCLVKDSRVDVALVVEKTNSGRYLGATIYELSWAYKCARLVCRPDSDWLTVAATGSNQDEVL